jgi:ABC-2 type transport system permease protein
VFRRAFIVFLNDARLLRRDLATLVTALVVPLFVMLMFKPVAGVALRNQGQEHASGAEQVVPGTVCMFGFFVVVVVCFAFFWEHGWGTWPRLRVDARSSASIVFGKMAAPFVVALLQFTAFVGFGVVFLDLKVRGSVVAFGLVGLAYAVCMVSMGLAVAALSKTIQQASSIGYLSMVSLGILGGSFVPISLLPGWAQSVAPATPTYWGMRGFRSVLLSAGDTWAVTGSILMLLVFAAAFIGIAAWRFRVTDEKIGWA